MHRTLVVSGLLVTLASASYGEKLPPQEAPAYSAVYHAVTRGRDKVGDEWKYGTDESVTIAVRNKQSRWDHQSDGTTRINDAVSRYTTTFGGKVPPKTAYRTRAEFVAIGWEFGYVNVATATQAEPEVLGTDTIAGQTCTRLRYTSEQYGTPEFCVTKTGIVLRFANASSNAEATYEATSVDEKAPDANRFTTPATYKVEERGGPRRLKPIF